MSNNGLNSKEAFDESTAASSSVRLSGARRAKEIANRLDIQEYRTKPENSDRRRDQSTVKRLKPSIITVFGKAFFDFGAFSKRSSEKPEKGVVTITRTHARESACSWCVTGLVALNIEFHYRMNFPHSVVRHVFATVALIFRSMAYVPVRFPNNCDDRSASSQCQCEKNCEHSAMAERRLLKAVLIQVRPR